MTAVGRLPKLTQVFSSAFKLPALGNAAVNGVPSAA
jgi:hypothetical protein